MNTKYLQALSSFRVTKALVGNVVFALILSIAYSAHALNLTQSPLFVGQNARPVVMLAMSRDQELFYKAYPDYSNLTGGNLSMADTTYRNDFEYAGYYDPKWCYQYVSNATVANSKFIPDALATNHKCTTNATGRWSGNFLNWVSMTRMDILREVLYGGMRSVDTAVAGSVVAETVLERAFIPKDSHAFVKVYKSTTSNTISDFTPYTDNTLSFCNVSTNSGATGYPLIRVARGDWAQWSHTEVQQCQWRGGNTTYSTSPHKTTDQVTELVAKVSVCVPGKDGEPNQYDASTEEGRCKSYETGSFKPIGVLQTSYTDTDFGLVTGTWGKPDKGGVLRKKASRMAGNVYSGTDTINEFSEATGVFNANAATGIIKTINGINIKNFTYTATDGGKSYSNVTGSNSGDWRNPIGEIYAETLRYLLGTQSPTSTFAAADSWLSQVTAWDDPMPANSWCSKCSIVLISSGPNSFDGDDLTNTYLGTIKSGLSRTILNTKTDTIGLTEFGAVSNKVFYGGSAVSSQCSVVPKKMSELLGQCPEFPISGGTYDIAGLAYWARTTDVRTGAGYSGDQTITTYAVELSEGLPNLQIPVGSNKFSFVPICTNASTTSCSLVGVKVENVVNDSSGKPISGSYLFYWEDQPWASDYDMDAVQRIQFCVGTACGGSVQPNQIKITNTLPYWATGTGRMDMFYTVAGVATGEGPQLASSVYRSGSTAHNLGYTSSLGSSQWYNTILPQGTDGLPANNAGTAIYTTTKVFDVTAGSAIQVNTPLYYAAKYGGFTETSSTTVQLPDQVSEWDAKDSNEQPGADGVPDNYFKMRDPSQLRKRLVGILNGARPGASSGTGVSANSTKLEAGTRIYQATFYASGWYGSLNSLKESTNSLTDFETEWTTLNQLNGSTGRKIISSANNVGIDFTSSSFTTKYTAAQQTDLGGATNGPKIIDWVRGDDVAGLRSRQTTDNGLPNGKPTGKQVMGDIVNSAPVYAGQDGQRFEKLDPVYGASSYLGFVSGTKAARKDVVYVGANDGMLHAIDAQNGAELFAYVPSLIYSKLPLIADGTYGKSTPHTYTVDGPTTVGDAFINGTWKTILVGTLGAGGRGIFVLDVTDPTNFSKANVLYEVSATNYPEIGNVMGKPLIVPMGGRWKIIFGNGYNSGSGNASLFVLDIEQPFNSTYSKVITAGSSTNNGLGRVTALQNATTGAVERVYAGDLLGNMWRFDLSSTSSSAWDVALGKNPLFTAKDSAGNGQPIFSSPTLGANTYLPTATMVYFGTGKYIESDDVGVTQMGRVQSFYGIADENASLTYLSSRSEILHEKTMTSTSTTRDVDDSGSSAVTVDWAQKKGWFLDFPAGERVISKPLLLYDRLIFPTVVPSLDVCTFGGSGWLMELVGVGDVYGTDHDLIPEGNGTVQEFYLPGDLIKLSDTIIPCAIDGTCGKIELDVPADPVPDTGRVSWRQVK